MYTCGRVPEESGRHTSDLCDTPLLLMGNRFLLHLRPRLEPPLVGRKTAVEVGDGLFSFFFFLNIRTVRGWGRCGTASMEEPVRGDHRGKGLLSRTRT